MGIIQLFKGLFGNGGEKVASLTPSVAAPAAGMTNSAILTPPTDVTVAAPQLDASTVTPPSMETPAVITNSVTLAPLMVTPQSYDMTSSSDNQKEENVSLVETHSVAPVRAYCVRCKSKVEVQNPVQVNMKNGKPGMQGTCSVCKGKVFRIGKF